MGVELIFLFCVGVKKVGTSWMYRFLSCHLHSIKELNCFDRVGAIRVGRAYDYVVTTRLCAALGFLRIWVQLQKKMMGVLGLTAEPADFGKRVHESISIALDQGLRVRAQTALCMQ